MESLRSLGGLEQERARVERNQRLIVAALHITKLATDSEHNFLSRKFLVKIRQVPQRRQEEVAIFVDGDWWHGRDWLERGETPVANREYWSDEFERNVRRYNRVSLLSLAPAFERMVSAEVLGE